MRKLPVLLAVLLLVVAWLLRENFGTPFAVVQTKEPAPAKVEVATLPVQAAPSVTANAAAALIAPEPPIQAFAAWLERYRLAIPEQRLLLAAEGERLARQRKPVFYRLIAEDPKDALQAAVPSMQRKFLPRAIAQHLERPLSARGDLAVVAVTPRPGQRHLIKRPLYREARFGDETYDAYVYGQRARQDTKYGSSLSGFVLEDRMVVRDEPARLISVAEVPAGIALSDELALGEHKSPEARSEPKPILEQAGRYSPVCCAQHAAMLVDQAQAEEMTPGPWVEASGGESGVTGPAIAATPTQGAKSVLVIVADFSDRPGRPEDESASTPLTSSYISNRLAVEAADFFTQCSYGKTTIGSVTVTNVLRLAGTLAGYATQGATGNASGLKNAALTAASAAGYNSGDFDRVAVVFADTSTIPGNDFGFAGLADLGGDFSWFNGWFSLAIVTHELGHNYGARHANLWRVPNNSSNPVDPLGSSQEYGDDFDVMGSGPGNAATQPSVYNPWFLNRLDWLPNSAVQTVSTGGSYRLFRYDHAGADLNTARTLKIQRNATTDYWIGLRRKYLGHPTLSDAANGAYILWGYSNNVQSNLIDVDTPGTDNSRDAPLNVGNTFNDAAAGISFTVTGSGGTGEGEYIDVQVQFQPRLLFAQSAYEVDELAGSLAVTLQRRNNSAGAISVNYATSNGTALAGSDYTTTSGTLTWADGDATDRVIQIPIANNAAVEGAETFSLVFSNVMGAIMPNGNTLPITIQEAGALDEGFQVPFFTSVAVRAAVQSDAKVVVVGSFDSLEATGSNGIARLESNGASDVGYDQGEGVIVENVQRPMRACVLQQDGKAIVAGEFSSIRGAARKRIARLNSDGTLDTSFDVGTGPNDSVNVLAVQPDGKILVGGEFTTWNGVARPRLARLNEDGSLDSTLGKFDAVVDSHSSVDAIVLQPTATAPHFRIIVGGAFSRPYAGGGFHSGIVALNAVNGVRDSSFNVVYGAHQANDPLSLFWVSSLAVQSDGKVLVGGGFSAFNNANVNRLVRLTNTGANDTSFISALGGGLTGASSDVDALLIQCDGKIVVGGTFSTGVGSSRPKLARLNGSGSLDTLFQPDVATALGVNGLTMQPDGKLIAALNGAGVDLNGVSEALRRYFTSQPELPSVVQISGTSVASVEGSNAMITVRRAGGTLGAISVNYSTVARTAEAGGDFTTTTGTLAWANGDGADKTIIVPTTLDATVETDEVFEVRLGAPVGGVLLGANQIATVTILAGDLTGVPLVSFDTGASSAGEGGGTVNVTLKADPAPTSAFTVAFSASGTAVIGAGKDYTLGTSPISFGVGEISKSIPVTLLQDSVLDPGKTVVLQLGAINGIALATTPSAHTLTITDDEAAPVFTQQPAHRFANVGLPTTFQALVTANPAPTYQWLKGTANLAGAKSNSYIISKVALTHAGTYKLVAKSLGVSVPSSGADLVVVDPVAKRIVVPTTSAPVKMTALFAGNVTGFQWKKDIVSNVINQTGRFSGAQTKTLTLSGFATTDSGDYQCALVSPTAGTGAGGVFTLIVTNGTPQFLTKPATLTMATVGALYSFPTDLNTARERTPVTVTASGLPTGLKIDLNGVISGRPYVALTAPKVYTITVKATNSHGSDSFVTKLTLNPLPAGTVGSFAGFVPRHATINGNLGGRFDITTTTAGGITGKLINGATSHALGGTLEVDPVSLVPSAVITTTTSPSLTLTFAIDAPNNRITNGSLQKGLDTVNFNAWRNAPPTASYQGYFTFGMDMPGGNPTAPQGTGFGSFTIGANGKLTVSGKLAHGLGFSTATFVGPLGEVLVHQSSATGDTILGALDIAPGAPATLTGAVTWSRFTQPATSRLYEDSFGPVSLAPIGGLYVKPATTAPIMGLAYVAGVTTTNASLTFTGGQFGTPAVSPDIPVLIKPVGNPVVPPTVPLNGSTNPRKTTLKVASATGAVSGGFTMVDPNPLPPFTNITRTGTWFGQVFLDGGVQKCRGFFLLNNLPAVAGETKDNTDTVSGPVVLQ